MKSNGVSANIRLRQLKKRLAMNSPGFARRCHKLEFRPEWFVPPPVPAPAPVPVPVFAPDGRSA